MKKILALIIDGLGVNEKDEDNFLKRIKMPNYNKLLEEYPHSKLEVSGSAIGNPEGQSGTLEMGYQTLGAGTILKQKSSYVREFLEIDNLSTDTNIKLAVEHIKKHKSTFHIIGLMSDEGTISNISDVLKLSEFLKKEEVEFGVDFIADSNENTKKLADEYIGILEKAEIPIFSVCGKYYAMDNDNKWDRVKVYYDLIRNGIGLKVRDIHLALKNCYIRKITDAYLPPMIIEQDRNIKDNDVIFWTNYQSEGCIEILTALTNPDEISAFSAKKLFNTLFLTLYKINDSVLATNLIDEEKEKNTSLGEYFGALEVTQARLATKDAYDYVTSIFDGNHKSNIPKCTNILIDAPKTIPGKEEELDTALLTKQIVKCMEKDTDFILASFHTANLMYQRNDIPRTIEVLEFMDECLGKIIEASELNFYTIMILSTTTGLESISTNEEQAEEKKEEKVPFILTDTKYKVNDGSLADIAPTILSYMDISIPSSMKDSNVLIEE